MGSEILLDVAATEARHRGNNLYKQGKLTQAETAYLEASRLAPDDARPLSNLAAVYYELAEYTKCVDTCRASLLLLDEDGGEGLADKTRARLFKALLFSHKADEAKAVLSLVTSEATRRALQPSLTRTSTNLQSPSSLLSIRKKLLDRVARYRAVLQDEPEYYSVGHDDAHSFLLEDQLQNDKDLACLSCGIGDARILFATIVVAAAVVPATSSKQLHFTLVDVKPAVFARDLLIFRMLVDLQTQTKEEREETNVVIAYVFAAQVMPAWAFNILQRAITALIAALKDSSTNVMGILYIPDPVRGRIMHVLEQWQQSPKPWYTAAALRHILQRESATRQMQQFGMYGDMEPDSEKIPPGCAKHDPDMRSFSDIHVLLPFVHLMQKYEPRLLEIHKAYDKTRSRSDRKALDDYLDSNWQPNVTVIDLDFELKREDHGTFLGHPNIHWSPHQIVSELYSTIPHQTAQCSPGVLPYIHEFFNIVGSCLKRLSPRLVIEVVLGEMNDTFERLRYGLLRDGHKPVKNLDPTKFPNQFDKIDMSNIPDYVGGALTSFLHAVPLLREEGKSLLRSYVLRNTPAWRTHDQILAEYLVLGDRKTIESHFRATLIGSSVAMEKEWDGVEVGPGGIVMLPGFEWERNGSLAVPLPAKVRMSRPQLEHWLHAHFLKLCLPYPRVRFEPTGVYAPLNLTAFLHLVAHTASLGYPLHWLSATLAALCGGLLSRTRAGPPVAEITNEILARKTYPAADVSVAPFAAEFRTLVAMWEPVLGVPLVWDTVAGDEPLLPELSVIRRFTIQFPSQRIEDTQLMTACFSLVIKPQSFEARGNHLAHLLDDRQGDPSPAARSARRAPRMHLISACKWTSDTMTVEFWMDERVIDGVLAEKGWEAWIWRTDAWESVLGPVSLDGKTALVKNEGWS